jgi:hypothetical protein
VAGLAALLGRTRAKAIRAIAAGCTTTELAEALGAALLHVNTDKRVR